MIVINITFTMSGVGVFDQPNAKRCNNHLYTLTIPNSPTPHQPPCHQIGLQDFLRLFLNHRPARGEDTAQLEKVFKVHIPFSKTFKYELKGETHQAQRKNTASVTDYCQGDTISKISDRHHMFDSNVKVIGKDQMEDPSEVPTITR